MSYIIITPSDKKKANIRAGRKEYRTLNEARQAAIKVLQKKFDMYGIGDDVAIRKLDPYYAKRGIEAYIQSGWVTSHPYNYGEDVYFTYRSYNRGMRYGYDITDARIDLKGTTVKKKKKKNEYGVPDNWHPFGL